MALQCSDTDRLVHLYIDRELRDVERSELEAHLHTCQTCRKRVRDELAFVAGVRARLAPPHATAELHRRVARSLTSVPDSRARRWAWPLVSTAAAIAACIMAFVMTAPARTQAPRPVDLIAHHIHEPIELPVDNPDRLPQMIQTYTGMWVPPPRLASRDAELRRAWVTRLDGGHRAVGLEYRLTSDRRARAGQSVIVYAFDPRTVTPRTVRPVARRAVRASKTVYTTTSQGWNMVFYTKNGTGFAVVSGLGEDQLLSLLTGELTP